MAAVLTTVASLLLSPFLIDSANAAAKIKRVDDSATTTTPAALAYVGDWKVGTGTDKYKHGDHRTAKAGNRVEITYTGTRLHVLGPKGAYLGKASISVDGGPSVVLDSYSPHPPAERVGSWCCQHSGERQSHRSPWACGG